MKTKVYDENDREEKEKGEREFFMNKMGKN